MTRRVLLENWIDVKAEVHFGLDTGPCICVEVDGEYAFFPLSDLPIDDFWGLDIPEQAARKLVADALRSLADRVEQNKDRT